MLRNLELKSIYRSYGEDSISDIMSPLLANAVSYKRSVGFFSTSSLNITSNGLNQLILNRKKFGLECKHPFIQFIASPTISASDKEAIELGYKNRDEVIKNAFINEFKYTLNQLDDDNLNLLVDLITYNYVDIKIAKTKGLGTYHDKFGIIEDENGDIIAFNGSSNESENGFRDNYERILIFKSWKNNEEAFVKDDLNEFDSLWNGKNEFNDVYEFPEAIRESIIEVRNSRSDKSNNCAYKPYEYQIKAINAWKDNGCKGFFVMATGTGKTLTSLFSLQEVFNKEPLFTVIAVPYKHLIAQWFEDVKKIFPNVKIQMVSSEFNNWDNKLRNFLMLNKLKKEKEPIIVITTIKSFYSDKFENVFSYNKMKTCLIVDEAHNFLNKIYERKYFIDYDYKIGLSATPVFGSNSQKTYDLLNFFGGEVYSLPIEEAIGKYLVDYNYHPIFVEATERDEEQFKFYTKKMASYIKDDVIINEEEYTKAFRARLRCISTAENKMNNLESIIKQIDAKDHFIVYCSDGKGDDSIRYLNHTIELLRGLGYDPSQFTATENMETRMRLIDSFNQGDIHTLVAIRCLDEGINIPSITKALILSSNNNYREFVQRRGRILRKYNDKKIADIYDVIVLPSNDCVEMAKIELRRFNEYMKVAKNFDNVRSILNKYLYEYGLNIDDIQFENDYLIGGELDD